MADPIHGLIRFDRNDADHRLLLDVMNSRSFQRLRRIRQMGMAEFVFPGATHSRFAHSIGAAHLMMQAVAHLGHSKHCRQILESHYPGTKITLKRLMLLGILVHDIGHGPLSHTLEDILDLGAQGLLHDYYWKRRILTEDEDLQKIWNKYGLDLPDTVLSFGGETGPKHFLAHLISSQLDMDRLDYLQRDSHFLGVQYGRIEADRILTNLDISHAANGQDSVITIREEALPAIEHYLFGRHQAYKMALHSLDKASESLLKKTLERFKWARENGINTACRADALYQLIIDGKQLSISQYLRMDDYYLWEAINCWSTDADDALLRNLATRLMTHDLFKFINVAKFTCRNPEKPLDDVYQALAEHYASRGLSFEFGFEETLVEPKPMYQLAPYRDPIWIQTSEGVKVLSEVSTLPLEVNPNRGQKHLLFVWDKEAKIFLEQLLIKEYEG